MSRILHIPTGITSAEFDTIFLKQMLYYTFDYIPKCWDRHSIPGEFRHDIKRFISLLYEKEYGHLNQIQQFRMHYSKLEFEIINE